MSQLFLCSTKYLDISQGSSQTVCHLCCISLLRLALKSKIFLVLRNSKPTEQTNQNNSYFFFLLIMIKTKSNKQKK